MSEMPRVFTATAEVVLPSPQEAMLRLCDRFREFGEVTGRAACRRIETGFGTADLEDCGRCLRICATGRDEVGLAYVKLAMAEHLLSLAGDAPSIIWQGDGAAGSPLPYFREMRVKSARQVTPHMLRLTLSGENLERFETGGMHVRLLLPKDKHRIPQWPVTGSDGRPVWPEGEDRPDIRIYTLRRVDAAAGEVDIDFVMHDGASMPGASFARNARPGDVVGMTGPGGGGAGDADWYLLMGDETALPAIGRILEELPPAAQAVVRVEVADAGDIQALAVRPGIDVEWILRSQQGQGGLVRALNAVEWPVDGRRVFAWAGCEFQDFVEIRSYLRKVRGLVRDQHLAVAYWRRGFAGDEARQRAK